MKSLYILRHAKSSWKDGSLPDFERPLKKRGKRDSETVGKLFIKKELIPDLVISSPAVRARETAELVLKAAKLDVEVLYDERIYEAGPLRLLEIISQIENDRKTVLLVGHNPGMEELLHLLTGEVAHMPTSALAKITFKPSKWSAVGNMKGDLAWLVRPRDLDGETAEN